MFKPFYAAVIRHAYGGARLCAQSNGVGRRLFYRIVVILENVRIASALPEVGRPCRLVSLLQIAGDVDGDDFLLWQRNFPVLDGTADNSSGDGNVDGVDFLVWQRNFPYPTAISSVPEPNSLALLALGGLLMLRRRRT